MGTGPLLARAAGRFLRTKGRVVALEVARELQRRRRMGLPGPGAATGTASHTPTAPSAPPSPSGIRAAVVYYGWLASLAALALVILNVDQFAGPGTVRTVLRLVLGSILFVEGSLLLTDWQRARTLLLSRFLSRAHRHHGAFRIGRVWWMRAGATILTLFGLVLFAAGLFDLLRGAFDT
jgi:hypothetical protein